MGARPLGRPEPDRARAEELYVRYLAEREAGLEPDFEQWVQRHPDLEAELRELHEICRELESGLDDLARADPDRSFFRLLRGDEPPEGEPELALEPGRRVGSYVLRRLLGRGGMGAVWEAFDLRLRRRVALKVLALDRLDERGIAYFEREARAGARLAHPGIVAVHNTGADEGLYWIDQELVEGGVTLAHFLRAVRDEPALPPGYHGRVAELFLQVARALHASHTSGVIHRDIKPQNLLISPEDRPKITDFGLARIVDEASVSNAGDVVGTYRYMSPEQVSGDGRRVDERTDQFSLGVVLYEALTLHRPFDADSTHEITARILFHDPPRADRVRTDVPRDLGVLCARLLAKSPGGRFRSMEALAEELQRFLDGRPIHTRPAGPARHVGLWIRRRPTLSATLAVAVAALATIGVLFGLHRRQVVALDHAQAQVHYAEARYELLQGDVDGARAALAEARRYAPRATTGHLILASGLASLGQNTEAQVEVERAIEKGFDPADDAPDSAEDCHALGLYLALHGGEATLARAEALVARALELDPAETGAWLTLYEVRLARGDASGARRALSAFRGTLALEDPRAPLIEARLLELDGRPAAALAAVAAFEDRPEVGPAELQRERVLRLRGRLELQVGQLEDAVESLRAAVIDFPDDFAAWMNLATARFAQATRAGGAPARALRAEAASAARAALALRDDDDARTFLAGLTVLDVEQALSSSAPVPAELRADLRSELEQLIRAHPEDPLPAQYLAALCFLEGFAEVGHAEPMELYTEALRLDPEELRARVMRAQCLMEDDGQPEAALVELERALETWRDALDAPPPAPGASAVARRWPGFWYATLQVWRFGAASAVGEHDQARDAREGLEAALAEGTVVGPAELLTYAGFLAAAPEELRDCPRALELVEDHDLRAAFPGHPQAEATLREIDGACPR